MKATLFSGLIVILALSSCMKTKTCTCKDATGAVISENSKRTNNRAEMKKFEDNCKNKSITVSYSGTSGNSSTKIPCELK